MASKCVLAVAVAAAIGFCAPSVARDPADQTRLNPVPGEKLDSGLGQLPHYRARQEASKTDATRVSGRPNPVAGEKLDSGLGDLLLPARPAQAPAAVHASRS